MINHQSLAFYRLTLLVCLVLSPLALAKDTLKSEQQLKTAIFAGGCFWCMEPPFDKLDGVVSTTSGYTGGAIKNPSYKQVSSGSTGHYEVVKVTYDSNKIAYPALLNTFWKNIDPVDSRGQFCDKGQQYLSAIFFVDQEQKKLAERSKQQIVNSDYFDQVIATPVLAAAEFYPAEEYHQDYYKKNPIRYKFYRGRCGRDKRLEQLWRGKVLPPSLNLKTPVDR